MLTMNYLMKKLRKQFYAQYQTKVKSQLKEDESLQIQGHNN